MHRDLSEAIEFHNAIIAEGGKALVGYETAKALANVVLLSEIPTTYDKKENRQVNAGNLLLRGVPGVGKTFFGVILAAISNAKFARLQGRADLQPTEVVGFQMINPATGALVTEFGPLASAEVILLDEINRIPLKSQSAFLEGLQDRTVTVGKETYELPAFSFAIATMNPVELGQGTFPLSEAATDRFAVMINIGYLPPEEEEKLVNFDFKHVRLNVLMTKERVIELRSAISEQVFLHERLGKYIQRLVAATRPYNPDTDWLTYSPSELVERGVDLGASPRAIICWGRIAKVWAILQRHRTEVYPEDIQELAPYILSHRIWLGPARRQPRADDGRGHPRHPRSGADSVKPTIPGDSAPLVNLADITEIELVILRRMKDVTIGEHRSRSHGTGFDFLGLRDWQAGDRFSSIDWAQSSLTNFSPMIVREFEQPSTATVVAIADHSLSTRCGVDGVPIAAGVARAIATVGISASFFQDPFGLVTFDSGFTHLAAIRPADGQEPRGPLCGRLPAPAEPARGQADRRRRRHAGRLPAQQVDAAGDLRFSLRRSRGDPEGARVPERDPRRVHRARRRRVRLRPAAHFVGLDRDRRRRDGPLPDHVASRDGQDGRADSRLADRRPPAREEPRSRRRADRAGFHEVRYRAERVRGRAAVAEDV